MSPLFKLLEAGMELLVPLVVGKIVDVGVKTGNVPYIVHAVLLLAGFGAVGLAFALTAQYFAAKAAVGVSADLRSKLFSKLQTFSYAQIDDMGTSSMITRMTSDVNQVQTGVNMLLRLFLRSPVVVFGATAFAFFIDAYAGLVFAAVIPLLFLAVFGVIYATVPRYRRVQEELDGVYLSARENLSGARVVRAFRLEGEEISAFSQKSERLERSQTKVGRIAAVTAPVTFLLVELAAIALIAVGGFRVDGGALAQGDVISLYGYLSLILVELVKFANLIITLSKSFAAQRRVSAVLDMQGERADEGGKAVPRTERGVSLSFDNVSFTYEGGAAPALKGISFRAEAGETLGILGGTGAGKSTLVRLIPRFYEAEGEISVGGVPIGELSLQDLRAAVGYVPQKTTLFRGTISSNLRWGKADASDEELLSALAAAQATDVLQAKGGLEGEVAQNGKNLSGGQRQRLAIARALVRRPALLILDDASSALDYATDARLRASLKGVGCTVVLVSQRIESVKHADRILLMDEGEIADMGTHEELMARSALYREIYRSQTEGPDEA